MLQRIRLAMQSQSFSMLTGEIEVDETYIGGKARNMHKANRHKAGRGRSMDNKTAVIGMVERGGRISVHVVDSVKRRTLQSYVRDRIEPGATVYTDALPSYAGLGRDFDHRTVNHAIQYVDGQVHTNVIENFWSLLKRGLHGTYISVRPFHLFRYLDERMFTSTSANTATWGAFDKVLEAVAGRRLTYARLTGHG